MNEWKDVIANDPLLRGVIALAIFVTIIMFGNDARKRFFTPLSEKKLTLSDDETITQELRALRDGWRELAEAQHDRIKELQEDITETKLELKRIKTEPIDNETLNQLNNE